MTEEELAQYKQLALDQIRREAKRWWVNGALLVVAVTSGGWGLASWYQGGFWPRPLWALGVAGMAVYWPWRSRRTEQFWQGHAEAVGAELRRRERS